MATMNLKSLFLFCLCIGGEDADSAAFLSMVLAKEQEMDASQTL
jgi:hypothetical protein